MTNKKLEDVVREQYMDKANDVINLTYNKLVVEEKHNEYPLELFDAYFAPYFFQGKPLPKDSDIFAVWISIAGSPMAPVDIVNDKGVVFTIPPLYNTDLINLVGKENTVSRTMDEFSLYADSAPGKVMGFIQDRLIPAAESTVNTKVDKGLDEWAQIASRYRNDIPKKESQGAINNTDDDLNYDDI